MHYNETSWRDGEFFSFNCTSQSLSTLVQSQTPYFKINLSHFDDWYISYCHSNEGSSKEVGTETNEAGGTMCYVNMSPLNYELYFDFQFLMTYI